MGSDWPEEERLSKGPRPGPHPSKDLSVWQPLEGWMRSLQWTACPRGSFTPTCTTLSERGGTAGGVCLSLTHGKDICCQQGPRAGTGKVQSQVRNA